MKEHSQEWPLQKRLKNVGLGRPDATKERKSSGDILLAAGGALLHEAERKEARRFMDFVWDWRIEVVRRVSIRAGRLQRGRDRGKRVREGGAGYRCWDPWKWRAAERE